MQVIYEKKFQGSFISVGYPPKSSWGHKNESGALGGCLSRFKVNLEREQMLLNHKFKLKKEKLYKDLVSRRL